MSKRTKRIWVTISDRDGVTVSMHAKTPNIWGGRTETMTRVVNASKGTLDRINRIHMKYRPSDVNVSLYQTFTSTCVMFEDMDYIGGVMKVREQKEAV